MCEFRFVTFGRITDALKIFFILLNYINVAYLKCLRFLVLDLG